MLQAVESENRSKIPPSRAVRDELLGVNALARALKEDAGNISRYFAAGVIPNHGTDDRPLCSVRGAKKALTENVKAKSRSEGKSGNRRKKGAIYAKERAEHEAVKRQLSALKLAETEGDLVAKAEAEDLFSTFGRRLRDGMAQRWRLLAAEMAGKSPVEIEKRGIAADEALLTRIADEVSREFAQ